MSHRNETSRVRAQALPQARIRLGTPKALFFAAAGLSFLMSVYLFFSGDHERGIFVGIWVPSILSAGNLLLEDGGNV